MKKLFAVLVTAITAYIGLALVAGTPANATGCTTAMHYDLGNLTYEKTAGVETSAKADLTPDRVRLWTPDNDAYVAIVFADSSLLKNVTPGTYDTYKYDTTAPVVLPGYKIEVHLEGGTTSADFTTLVYEPYQDKGNAAIHVGEWQTWDPYNNGDALWWSTHPLAKIPSDAGQSTPEKWSTIVHAYPNAKVVDYYIGQGTYNAGGVTAFRNVTYSGDDGCVLHKWTSIKPTPKSGPTTPPATTPAQGTGNGGTHQGTVGGGGGTAGTNGSHPLLTTPDAGLAPTTGSPSPSPSQEAAALPTDGPSDSLAPLAPTVAATPNLQKTGHAMAWTGGVVLGLLLVAGAIVVLRQGRQRRRTQAQHAASGQPATYQQGRVGVDPDPTQTTELPPYQE